MHYISYTSLKFIFNIINTIIILESISLLILIKD